MWPVGSAELSVDWSRRTASARVANSIRWRPASGGERLGRAGAPVDCDRGPVIELDGPLGDPSRSATGYSTKPVRLSVTARIDPVSPPALSTVVNVQSPPTVASSSADNGEIGW